MRHTTKVSQQVLQEYNEMVQDTAYNLEIHLQRIDEIMERLPTESSNTSDITIDLRDEKEVTKQCLRVCEDAKSYIESLTNRESSLLQEAPQNAPQTGAEDYTQQFFEAQLLTRQALDKNRDNFAEIISHLQERLKSQIMNGDPKDDGERLRLQEDINISKQCLEVCKIASEVSRQKIYRVGEAVADGDSDQVVVTTLADLFDVKKALSKGRSAQLVGSMTDDSLRHVADKRYDSRFGAVVGDSDHSDPAKASTTNSHSVLETQKSTRASPSQTNSDEQSAGPNTGRNRPFPNEMRKRVADDATD